MRKESVLETVRQLAGNEQSWVDFKEDYYAGGIPYRKAEFIKDIAALANTRAGQEQHYIFVGVNDDGEIVGVSEDEVDDTNGQRHLLSFDESDLQQIINDNLSPSPEFALYDYDHDDMRIAALVITPLDEPPCVAKKDIQKDSTTFVYSGDIYVRKGSSNTRIDRDALEQMISHRIDRERDKILDSVHKAVEMGPEVIEAMSDVVGTAGAPVHHDTTASAGLEQQFTRRSPQTGDEELNSDISLWKIRDRYRLDRKPLWQYYHRASEIDLDEVATEFLLKSSVEYQLTGFYWLYNGAYEDLVDILNRTDNLLEVRELPAAILYLKGDESQFEAFIEESESISLSGHGPFADYYDSLDKSTARKANDLIKNREYSLTFNDTKIEFNISSLSEDEILDLIPRVSVGLSDLQSHVDEHATKVYLRDQFKDGLHDLEIALAREYYAN